MNAATEAEADSWEIPLHLKSIFSGPTWIAMGVLSLFFGLAGLAGTLRAPARPWGVCIALATALLGLAAIRKGVSVLTETITVSNAGIRRSTRFGSRAINWKDVELLSVCLETAQRPFHGRFRVESPRAGIRFRTRPEHFERVARFLTDACPGSCLLDEATGEVTPLPDAQYLQVRQRMPAICARVSRRYRHLAYVQLVILPVLPVLWVGALASSFIFLGCMPFGVGSILRNFRRSREARRSVRRALDRLEGGAPPGPGQDG